MRARALGPLVCALLLVSAANAYQPPLPQSWVTDTAGKLSPEDKAFLDARLKAFQDETGARLQMAGGEVIDLIRAKGDPAGLSDEERDIVTYVRQLMRTNRVDQAVFDRLKNRHDAQWMVELTEVANYFAFLSGMVNPFEVPAPPDGDKLPS